MTALYPVVSLKAGREDSVRYRHPWVFSGALSDFGQLPAIGSLARVADSRGQILGVATTGRGSIALRMLSDRDETIDRAWLQRRIEAANARRMRLGYGEPGVSTGYRMVFGESDGLPGLVIDRYDDCLVIQISTAGMESLKTMLLEALRALFPACAIVERSDLAVREEEGLSAHKGTLYGDAPRLVQFFQNGLRFVADPLHGHKTGFYLDLQQVRQRVRELAQGCRVLDMFAYTGATGVHALAGGALSVRHVDSSAEALTGCLEHAEINGLAGKSETVEADVFDYLGQSKDEYDMVIVDPPGLIKDQRHIEAGKQAYHFLNRAALRCIRPGGWLVSVSCSRFLSEDDMVFMLRRAAVQAGRRLHVAHRVTQSPDHPLSVDWPEAHYLKAYIVEVR